MPLNTFDLQPRALQVLAAGLAVCLTLVSATSGNARIITLTSELPLAFLRQVALAPIEMIANSPRPPAALRSSTDKRARARHAEEMAAYQAWQRLYSLSTTRLQSALTKRFLRVDGVSLDASLVPDNPATLISLPGSATVPRRDLLPEVRREAASAFVRTVGSDAALVVAIDRFTETSGLERTITMRVAGYLVPSGDEKPRGPYMAMAVGKSYPKFIGKGRDRTDEELLDLVCSEVADRLVNTLETGREPLFLRSARIAILPSALPASIRKQIQEAEDAVVPLPALVRQADVLLQPDLTPFVTLLDDDDVLDALAALQVDPVRLWRVGGEPDLESLARIAAHLRADYLFLSHARNHSLAEKPVLVYDGEEPRAGVERRAEMQVEALLFRAVDKAILWTDTETGTATATTEFVRHAPRVRTDEQCILDATRTAFAYLRFSFEEFRRR